MQVQRIVYCEILIYIIIILYNLERFAVFVINSKCLKEKPIYLTNICE